MISVSIFASTAVGQPVTDAELRRSLENAIGRDVGLRQADVQVSTNDGEVGLRGAVKSYVAKMRAEQIAKRERGVLAVHNWLQVDPELRSDQEIEHDVSRRLQLTYGLNPWALHVQVQDGAVTLAGTVSTWPQLRQAELIAGEVRGVKRIENKLVVESARDAVPPTVADELLETDVKTALLRDAYIGYLTIEVSVAKGVVRLDGKVPNLFHRERAEQEASAIAGVRSVENRLVVTSQLTLAISNVPLSDEELGQAILDELAVYPMLDETGIAVEAAAGDVSLTGQVASLFEKRTAARIARNVKGVARVDNQLLVRVSERTDAEVLADVQFILSSDALLAEQSFGVAVQKGALTLSGGSRDLRSKLRAAQVVARVPGVREISNQIVVKWNESTSDNALRDAIEEQLASNPTTRHVAPQIRVVVSQGQVTLIGRVEHTLELIEAARIARLTDSVRSVSNMLSVD
jgi:osmotically-inducible protein OsmY